MATEKEILIKIGASIDIIFVAIIPGWSLLSCILNGWTINSGASIVASAGNLLLKTVVAIFLYGFAMIFFLGFLSDVLGNILHRSFWEDRTKGRIWKKWLYFNIIFFSVIVTIMIPYKIMGVVTDTIFSAANDAVAESVNENHAAVEGSGNSSDKRAANNEVSTKRKEESLDWVPIEEYAGNTSYVYITPTGSCYHMIDCPRLSRTESVKPYRLGETPNGYRSCSVCDPWQYE